MTVTNSQSQANVHENFVGIYRIYTTVCGTTAVISSTEPTTLACIHGSAWSGDESSLLEDHANPFSSQYVNQM